MFCLSAFWFSGKRIRNASRSAWWEHGHGKGGFGHGYISLIGDDELLGADKRAPSSSQYIVSTSIYSYPIFDLGISGAGPTSV